MWLKLSKKALIATYLSEGSEDGLSVDEIDYYKYFINKYFDKTKENLL